MHSFPIPVSDLDVAWEGVFNGYVETKNVEPLSDFVTDEYAHHRVFPLRDHVFRAFQLTPFAKVRVVILGQDPYHGMGQAHGLAFSVPRGTKLPPSLRNVFKELVHDVNVPYPNHGELTAWAAQGVLLMNTVLTVREGLAGSHRGKGWEGFTDHIIQTLSDQHERLVFVLWGREAQRKRALIASDHHLILEAAHPSPLSAFNGFFGCRHFSKTNAFLKEHHHDSIDWALPF
jgi:uracil-DNA glycosylase